MSITNGIRSATKATASTQSRSRAQSGLESQPIDLNNTANIRIISIARTCSGFATVVFEVISKQKVRGRPRTKSRVEYNFETDETKPSVIAMQARDFILRWREVAGGG
jgi:hypothetical protein